MAGGAAPEALTEAREHRSFLASVNAPGGRRPPAPPVY
jgi:hypothetical protein